MTDQRYTDIALGLNKILKSRWPQMMMGPIYYHDVGNVQATVGWKSPWGLVEVEIYSNLKAEIFARNETVMRADIADWNPCRFH